MDPLWLVRRGGRPPGGPIYFDASRFSQEGVHYFRGDADCRSPDAYAEKVGERIQACFEHLHKPLNLVELVRPTACDFPVTKRINRMRYYEIIDIWRPKNTSPHEWSKGSRDIFIKPQHIAVSEKYRDVETTHCGK